MTVLWVNERMQEKYKTVTEEMKRLMTMCVYVCVDQYHMYSSASPSISDEEKYWEE